MKNMLVIDEGEDSAVKCRERRRRRMAVKGEGNKKCALKTTTNLIGNMETTPPLYGTMSASNAGRSFRSNELMPAGDQRVPTFFGVFDGQVSAVCKEQMHVIIKEELMHVKVVGDGGDESWRSAVNRSFQRTYEMALKQCSSSLICRCNPQLSLMGSSVVVSIVTKECMVVANCGDSLAVLCREGRPIPLSDYHKADEGGCGARIVSRPIDDIGFWAASEPKISVTKRDARDEFLILGSNGLWDVVSSELACKTVHECLGIPSVKPWIEGSASAATILVRLALGRRSSDNISAIVIDLRK